MAGTLWKHQNPKNLKFFKNKLLNNPKEQVGQGKLGIKGSIKIKHIKHNC
jgi:hypothetical protein